MASKPGHALARPAAGVLHSATAGSVKIAGPRNVGLLGIAVYTELTGDHPEGRPIVFCQIGQQDASERKQDCS
jgi:hypothetical protein